MADVLVGQTDEHAMDVVMHEDLLRAAQLAADTNALDRLIAADLLFTGPDGELATKEQDLRAHASGVVRFRDHEPIELRIRMVTPTLALAALKARLGVEVAGVLHTGTFRYTRLWQHGDNGSWQVVGGHVSAVTATP